MKHAFLNNPRLQKLVTALKSSGQSFRFVGGCVRDALLQRPVKDIDLAVPYPPQKTLEILHKNHIGAVPTGLSFGTITAIIDGEAFEITSLRKDIQTDGRHAVVTYTDAYEEDAMRRDLTINALFMDEDGNIDDYVGGLADLQTQTLRFVGDALTRMMEDHLRMLRLFRFASIFGPQKIDASALEACNLIAPLLTKLSKERIQKEFFKTLEGPYAAEVFDLMFEKGLLKPLFPFLHTSLLLKKLCSFYPQSSLHLKLCALATTPKYTENIIKEIKASKKDKNYTQKLWSSAEKLKDLHPSFFYLIQEEEGPEILKESLVLLHLKHPEKDVKNILCKIPFSIPPFPLTGADLLTLPIAPQNRGQILQKIKIWWYDKGAKASKDDCLRFIQQNFGDDAHKHL